MITLVIIGVIAAITVPSLINKTQNQEYVSKLKKAYSVLQNSIHKIALDKGYAQGDYTFLYNDDFIDEFSKTVSVTKKCDNAVDCFGSNFSSNGYYTNLDGTSELFLVGKSVITSDGIMYTARNGNMEGVSMYGIAPGDVVLGRIIVDVNGKKKPNKFGIDTFIFYIIDKKGILPSGYAKDKHCSRNAKGYTCAAKVLREGAMNY